MHPLHRLIAQILVGTEMVGGQPLLGKDCGGNQHIQLFCGGQAARATRFCSVDAIVLKEGKVKIVIEIEERDIRPTALCGKVVVSCLASHFIHQGTSFPLAEDDMFLQVMDTSKLSSNASKLDQCRYLNEAIRKTLSTGVGNLREYELFYGDIAEFERPEAQLELRDSLRDATSILTQGACEQRIRRDSA